MKPTPNHLDFTQQSPEKIRRWSKRQSFQWRLWHCWLKPSPHLRGLRRFYAWLPRLGVYAVLVLAMGLYALSLWTSRPSYTKSLAQTIKSITQATEVKTSSIRWGRHEANLLELQLIAPKDAWWNQIDLRNTLFASPWHRSFGANKWTYSQPNSGEIRIQLQPGNPPKELEYASSDLSPKETLKALPFEYLSWRSLKLQAGTELKGSPQKLEIQTHQGSWNPSKSPLAEARHVRFSFDFFQNRTADKLSVTQEGERHVLVLEGIHFEQGGTGSLSMAIHLQKGLPAQGELTFQKVSLKDLSPRFLHASLPLHVRLDGTMRFQTELQTNLPTTWEGSLIKNAEEKASFTAFSSLQAMASLFQKPLWRSAPIETLSARFSLDNQQLEVTEISIECLDHVRLQGSFINHGEILNGSFAIGIPNAIANPQREKLGRLFQSIKEEHSWEHSKIEGRLGTLGNDLSIKLLEQHRRNLRH